MEKRFVFPAVALFASALSSCGNNAAVNVPVVESATPVAAPRVVKVAPTEKPIVIFSGKSSFAPLPQMAPSSPVPRSRSVRTAPNLTQSLPVAPAPRDSVPTVQSAPPVQAAPLQSPPVSGGMVWVNHNSKIFHYPGSRWYQKTSDGRLMSENDALAAGYHAAENGQ